MKPVISIKELLLALPQSGTNHTAAPFLALLHAHLLIAEVGHPVPQRCQIQNCTDSEAACTMDLVTIESHLLLDD